MHFHWGQTLEALSLGQRHLWSTVMRLPLVFREGRDVCVLEMKLALLFMSLSHRRSGKIDFSSGNSSEFSNRSDCLMEFLWFFTFGNWNGKLLRDWKQRETHGENGNHKKRSNSLFVLLTLYVIQDAPSKSLGQTFQSEWLQGKTPKGISVYLSSYTDQKKTYSFEPGTNAGG